MFIELSRFEIKNRMDDAVKQTFVNRPGLVDNYPGVTRLEVMSPSDNPAEIWLLTYWQNETIFKDLHKNHLKESHRGIPKRLKLK